MYANLLLYYGGVAWRVSGVGHINNNDKLYRLIFYVFWSRILKFLQHHTE